MNEPNQTLDAQAELLVEAALRELGGTPLDDADEYAEQCDYAGCYPWLAEIVRAHPHDSVSSIAAPDADGGDDYAFAC